MSPAGSVQLGARSPLNTVTMKPFSSMAANDSRKKMTLKINVGKAGIFSRQLCKALPPQPSGSPLLPSIRPLLCLPVSSPHHHTLRFPEERSCLQGARF
ncbi:unnamed protein product [Rangifer tarandus platyrhynchus]|uniref:Uncharacterized protein n=1 Tax=Rangifer tarandus platyrhynchus TaxID=3082113 RepID=A0AC59YRM8_RANTA